MTYAKFLIIGSGPAGYTAAIYAGRAGWNPVLIEGPQSGGQLMTTTEVENYSGFPEGVEPYELMSRMRRQAERFGATIVSGKVSRVSLKGEKKQIWVDDTEQYEADVVIVATGAGARYLGIESERIYRGKGVSACATCDGFFYRKKPVAVVGGGDTACEEALYLAGLCEKVYLIVRKPYLRASQILQDRVFAEPKIEVLFEHNTLRLTGEERVEGADLVSRAGTDQEQQHHIDIRGFFLAIGHQPNTQLFREELDLDEEGYIRTQPGRTQTNIPGVFAAGDCMDPFYRQAIVAAGSGAKAAIEADHFLRS